MLDVAIRRSPTLGGVAGAVGTTSIDLGGREAPALPVDPALAGLLPDGLRRGSTVAVTGSISLLLALLGAASAGGAWCALVGFPHISAEAASAYGIELSRLAIIPAPGDGWATAVGALLDAVDVVAARPPRHIAPGDVRRLAARARTRDAVLVPFGNSSGNQRSSQHGSQHSSQRGSQHGSQHGGDWPGADVRLRAEAGPWSGIGTGQGRLQARRVEVTAEGRGAAARPRSATLWLPTATGGVGQVHSAERQVHSAERQVHSAEQLAPVIDLAG